MKLYYFFYTRTRAIELSFLYRTSKKRWRQFTAPHVTLLSPMFAILSMTLFLTTSKCSYTLSSRALSTCENNLMIFTIQLCDFLIDSNGIRQTMFFYLLLEQLYFLFY